MIKGKKGHFDLETLIVAIAVAVIAYLIAQANAIKQLYKSKFASKSEKNLRVRQ